MPPSGHPDRPWRPTTSTTTTTTTTASGWCVRRPHASSLLQPPWFPAMRRDGRASCQLPYPFAAEVEEKHGAGWSGLHAQHGRSSQWRQAKGFGGRHPLVETQRLIGEAALKRTDQTIAASIQPALAGFVCQTPISIGGLGGGRSARCPWTRGRCGTGSVRQRPRHAAARISHGTICLRRAGDVLHPHGIGRREEKVKRGDQTMKPARCAMFLAKTAPATPRVADAATRYEVIPDPAGRTAWCA